MMMDSLTKTIRKIRGEHIFDTLDPGIQNKMISILDNINETKKAGLGYQFKDAWELLQFFGQMSG